MAWEGGIGGGFSEGGRKGGGREKEMERGGMAQQSGKGAEEGGRGIMQEKKYNDTIIKYKRWDTYYGDYGSFPYI